MLDMAMCFDHSGHPQAFTLLQKSKIQLLWLVSFYIVVVCVSYLVIKIKHFDECPEVIPGLCSPCLPFFPSPRFNWICICSCSRAILWVPPSLIKKVHPLQKQLLKQLQRQLLSRYSALICIFIFSDLCEYTFKLDVSVMRGTEHFMLLQMSVVLTKEYNGMINSGGLIGSREYLML